MTRADVVAALELLRENRYLTLAVATAEGTPWIAPVFFAFDEELRVYWVSYRNARHSRLIATNPAVALAIFNAEHPERGLYVEAEAREMDGEALDGPIRPFNARADQDKFKIEGRADLVGAAAWRMYVAEPRRAFLLGEGKDVAGQHVDTREEIALPG